MGTIYHIDKDGNAVFTKNLTVDSGTLAVDATNNRVGVNNGSPAHPLDVTGNVSASGYLVSGTALASGNLSDGAHVVLDSMCTAKGDLIVATASSTVTNLPLVLTDNYVLTVDTSQATGMRWALAVGYGAATWAKYTYNFGAAPFNVGALTNTITIFTPSADQVIHGVKIRATTKFTGGGSATTTVNVGVSGNTFKYAPVAEIGAAASTGDIYLTNNFNAEDGATAIILTATSDVNLNLLTAGQVDVWMYVSSAA